MRQSLLLYVPMPGWTDQQTGQRGRQTYLCRDPEHPPQDYPAPTLLVLPLAMPQFPRSMLPHCQGREQSQPAAGHPESQR